MSILTTMSLESPFVEGLAVLYEVKANNFKKQSVFYFIRSQAAMPCSRMWVAHELYIVRLRSQVSFLKTAYTGQILR